MRGEVGAHAKSFLLDRFPRLLVRPVVADAQLAAHAATFRSRTLPVCRFTLNARSHSRHTHTRHCFVLKSRRFSYWW